MKIELSNLFDPPEKENDYIYELFPTIKIGGSSYSEGRASIIVGYELRATQGNGYDLIDEEISNIGVETAIESLIFPDEGLIYGKKYQARATNLSRDWESGQIDDYNIELFEVEP